jgi:kynurenine formamidase
VYAEGMKITQGRTHITDDMGNDVVAPSQLDAEYDALCAVADAADEEHRMHCLLLTANCPICKALAELDEVRQQQRQVQRN